jgi:carbamoyltransferase
MIILGVNGWRDVTHDAAACLVADGELLGFLEEERLSRNRYAPDTAPERAAAVLLSRAGLSIRDVDIVATGWDLPAYYSGRPGGWSISAESYVAEVAGAQVVEAPALEWYRHHDAHAFAAFVQSGFEEAAVLVVDGQGERDAISVYRVSGRVLEPMRRWPAPFSLGWLYEAATLHCGFQSYNAGKTMGLAAYGEAKPGFEPVAWANGNLTTVCPLDADENEVGGHFKRYIEDHFGHSIARRSAPFDRLSLRRDNSRDLPDDHLPDVAASVQRVVEEIMPRLAQEAMRATGLRNLCVTGGVALNCVANSRLLNLTEDLFIQPFANDAGVALGAAALAAQRHGFQLKGPFGAFLGPSFESSDIAAWLTQNCVPFELVDDPADCAARLLTAGAVIGWFQGPMEAGPRALGGRSILASAASASIRDRVNQIKGRELWRPLAPSILREESQRLFGRDFESPFMLLTLPLTAEGQRVAPALRHVDGSARPQTVAPHEGPFGRLLQRMQSLTGIGLVLNTSFNGPDEPLVCTPEHALRAFFSMPLDALILENCLIHKEAHHSS